MTHVAMFSCDHEFIHASIPTEFADNRPAVVYFAWAAHVFSAYINCRRYSSSCVHTV